jgi:hypothetical protein
MTDYFLSTSATRALVGSQILGKSAYAKSGRLDLDQVVAYRAKD